MTEAGVRGGLWPLMDTHTVPSTGRQAGRDRLQKLGKGLRQHQQEEQASKQVIAGRLQPSAWLGLSSNQAGMCPTMIKEDRPERVLEKTWSQKTATR